jgi:hypothetical protein
MNLKGCGKRQIWPNLKHYPVALRGNEGNTSNFSQDSHIMAKEGE